MKTKIIFAALIYLSVLSCRKTRTCSCTLTDTLVKTSTTANGNSQTSASTATTAIIENTYPSISRKDMIRYHNCNTRTVTSVKTFTSVSGTGTSSTVVNVNQTDDLHFDCKLK